MPAPQAEPELMVIDAEGLTALRTRAAAENRVLVIDCWATWCASCLQMFPKLHDAMAEYGNDVQLVSLCFDEGDDYIQRAERYLTSQDAWKDAYLAAEGDEAKTAIAKAIGINWDGGALPAVFVFGPGDLRPRFQLVETEGEPDNWVKQIDTVVALILEDMGVEQPSR